MLDNLNTNIVSIGQILNITDNRNSDRNELRNNTYTVKKGDSLYSIARQFDTTVKDIKELNKLTSNILKIDEVLIIPEEKI